MHALCRAIVSCELARELKPSSRAAFSKSCFPTITNDSCRLLERAPHWMWSDVELKRSAYAEFNKELHSGIRKDTNAGVSAKDCFIGSFINNCKRRATRSECRTLNSILQYRQLSCLTGFMQRTVCGVQSSSTKGRRQHLCGDHQITVCWVQDVCEVSESTELKSVQGCQWWRKPGS